ncbi:MAG TPA: ABC transporter permease subunit [Sphaerochaeta sp.]|nr:ABC transporter permease subunit [Sphaerochaeta sp.]
MHSQSKSIPLWQDKYKRQRLSQFIFALVVIILVALIYGNIVDSLSKIGMIPSLKFLRMVSNIDIGESVIEVSNTSSNLRMIVAGFLNTISIAFLAIIFSTMLGLIIALCRLSSNWIINKLAVLYIEIIRNIPLLLLLLIWYRAFFLRLPGIKTGIMAGERLGPSGETLLSFSLSNRGISMTTFKPNEHFQPWLLCLGIAFVAAFVLYLLLKRREKQTAKEQHTILYPVLAFLAVATLSYFILPNAALTKEVPVMGKFNISGGLHVTAEWFSLFSGLILYTSAFIAEIFRAGIQGIPKGQIEAARSLGLSHMQTIRLVIIPQAKVVVIPPLTSQFLGVAKNTSLGVAIGFPDLFAITGTIINQTGRALEMIILVMAIYLGLSLLTSLVMNIYNKRVQIKER